MKKSEILKYLNESNPKNVKYYYIHGEKLKQKILVAYIERLDWAHINTLGEHILNIAAATERNDNTIRVALECEID